MNSQKIWYYNMPRDIHYSKAQMLLLTKAAKKRKKLKDILERLKIKRAQNAE